ncbi:MAG: TPM domain-containing protein [Candidatus Acidiferrum sp.]
MPLPPSKCSSRLSRIFSPPLLLLFLFFASAPCISAEKIKDIHPTAYVTDLAHVITPAATARLENLCTELEQKTGAQMAIVTVSSLEGETVEQYGNELFQQLGVGNKKSDRGVLLLVAPPEHKYWTEVGYGLEPVINDARAGDAGRAMLPFFRQGNYSAGIETGAWQLANYVAADKGVTLAATAPARPVQPRNQSSPSFPIWPIFLLIFFVFHIIRAIFRSATGRGGRPRGGGWWLGPMIGGMLGGGGFGGSSGGWGGGGGGGGFGGFGGGSSGGGGAGGSW